MNRNDSRNPHIRHEIERLRAARRRHAEMFQAAIRAGMPLDKALDEAARQFDAEMDRE
jgi:hypothetical protein